MFIILATSVQIIRGKHYQAVISLGEPLFSGFELIADKCEFESRNEKTPTTVSDVIIKNNQVIESFNELVHFSTSDFTFGFVGFTRKGYEESKFHFKKA